MAKTYQVAALPVRRNLAGELQVLLVTSRETRRWVIPKGWPWRDRLDHDAAAGEAWEEAGVRGQPHHASVGSFIYDKRRHDEVRTLQVNVYLLDVTEEALDWPEVSQRQRQWFSPETAAGLVAEPDLRALLLALQGT